MLCFSDFSTVTPVTRTPPLPNLVPYLSVPAGLGGGGELPYPPTPTPWSNCCPRRLHPKCSHCNGESTISLPHHHFGRWGSWGHVDFPPFFQHLWATTVTGRILRCRRCWSLWFWEQNVTTNCLSSSDSANPHQASDALPQSFVGSLPPPPPLYKLRPCPSYSGCRDRINLAPNLRGGVT